MFLQRVGLAFMAGWLLNQTLGERNRRFPYAPPPLTSHEILAYQPLHSEYVDNSIEHSPERRISGDYEGDVPPSPYSPPPIDDSENEDFNESETEAFLMTTTLEPTTREPSTTREPIKRRKKRKMKRKIAALAEATFVDRIERRSSKKLRLRKKNRHHAAETYIALPPVIIPEASTVHTTLLPSQVEPIHFMPQVEPSLLHAHSQIHAPFIVQASEFHEQRNTRPSLVPSQIHNVQPLMLEQIHPHPHQHPLPTSPHTHPFLAAPQIHLPNRSIAPSRPESPPLPAAGRNLSPDPPPQFANTHNYQQTSSHVHSNSVSHAQFGKMQPFTLPWPQPAPVIHLTQHVMTTASPKKASPSTLRVKPTEKIKSYFRKRSSVSAHGNGVIKGHAHDHVSFKKRFHMTLFKIPFLSIHVDKKVYKDESLIADLGKRTGDSYAHA